MKACCLLFFLSIQNLYVLAQITSVTANAILQERYAEQLKANREYTANIVEYKKAKLQLFTHEKLLDSLRQVIDTLLIRETDKQKVYGLLNLASNTISGDVYEQIKKEDPEYSFQLN